MGELSTLDRVADWLDAEADKLEGETWQALSRCAAVSINAVAVLHTRAKMVRDGSWERTGNAGPKR